MATITWTAESQGWLEDIFEYIAGDNPSAAADTVQGIFDRAQALADFPLLGQRYAPSPRHVRILLYGHYRIAYMVEGDNNIVVLGVFHGALDISRYQL